MGLENQKFNQKTTEHLQKETMWVYQKGNILTPYSQEITLSSSFPFYIMTIQVAHNFNYKKVTGETDHDYFTNIPYFLVNDTRGYLYTNPGENVFYLQQWNGGGIYFDDGTNTIHYLKTAYMTSKYLKIQLILKRIAGSYTLTTRRYGVSYVIMSPSGSYAVAPGAGGGGSATDGYYELFKYDKDNSYLGNQSGSMQIPTSLYNSILSGFYPLVTSGDSDY